MRVLLIKPEFKNAFTKLSLIRTEPLELEYMSAICQRQGVEVQICDLTIRGKSLSAVLRTFNPDLVAITANFVHIYSVKKYVKTIKKFNPAILTMVGGPHSEVKPEDFWFDGVDIVCHSGGFRPFETLITEGVEADFSGIKGICYRKEGVWKKNEREVFDITTLPFPDRSHFERNKKKYKYVTMNPCAILKTSYSCPNQCNYCFSTLLNGGKYLCREPRDVVEEIKTIPCDNIWIVDDTFYVNTGKLEEFIELLKKENIKKSYSLYYRADFIANHPEHMKLLAEIGVTMCAVGLEVIEDEVLEKYNKKSSVNLIMRAIEVLKECNIECIGLFMVDIDAEKSYFKKLYDFIKKHELYLSTISILTPMPGTGQYEKYKDRIMTDDYRKWDFVHLIIEPTKMSKFTFCSKFYLLYVKLAMLIFKKKVLSAKYIRLAFSASVDYWVGAVKSIWRKR